eukprot:5636342-Alexandrium_andersonii.AAC.1
MAGALLLAYLSPSGALLPRLVLELLDLPVELAHALRHGCEAQGLGSLADLPALIWRLRGGAEGPADHPVYFPLDVDRPLLEALGLSPDG